MICTLENTTQPRRALNPAGGMVGRLATAVICLRQRLVDRIHAPGDAFAHELGWTVTTAPGRLGFGGRVYHDPRFAARAASAASVSGHPVGAVTATAVQITHEPEER